MEVGKSFNVPAVAQAKQYFNLLNSRPEPGQEGGKRRKSKRHGRKKRKNKKTHRKAKGALLTQLRKEGYTNKKRHNGPVKIGSNIRKNSKTRKKKGKRFRHKTGRKKRKYKKS